MERRLAAILAADVAGYSHHTELDEEASTATLRMYRAVVEESVSAHHGHIFSSAGDGIVAEFPSIVETIRCAVEIQNEIAERNAAREDGRMQFRIGVNLGDVITEENNLYGTGVNVAVRLEQLAEPGGICVSQTVYDQVRKIVDIPFEDIGERRLKNISDPVHVYRILPAPFDLLFLGLAASTLIAQRSLYAHVSAVAEALDRRDIGGARLAVAKIVGRDPDSLTEADVSRAAIESLAENLSDGIVAPVFWLVVAGLPGAALYKTINTADSMIGHRSRRHLAFGWAAARLDDLVSLPASRLSALWLAAAASLHAATTGRGAVEAVLRDARRHRSPNAGWPEAAMAGALSLRLAGPRIYDGILAPDNWMGDGRADAGADDIRRALNLYWTACLIQAAVVALLAAIVFSV